mmetsp:Transcript_15581/g.39874  ORF Transcript_15581/g.39874 Transcript_15581/m.39874 type:complete len:236 (-) Transcript_15581:794-1501(-)
MEPPHRNVRSSDSSEVILVRFFLGLFRRLFLAFSGRGARVIRQKPQRVLQMGSDRRHVGLGEDELAVPVVHLAFVALENARLRVAKPAKVGKLGARDELVPVVLEARVAAVDVHGVVEFVGEELDEDREGRHEEGVDFVGAVNGDHARDGAHGFVLLLKVHAVELQDLQLEVLRLDLVPQHREQHLLAVLGHRAPGAAVAAAVDVYELLLHREQRGAAVQDRVNSRAVPQRVQRD